MYLILLSASVAIFCIVTLVYVRQEFSSIYHPITLYLVFHGLVFTIRPIFAYWRSYDFLYRAYEFNPSPDVKSTVIVAANLGLLAFVAGAWKTGDAPLAFRQGAADIAHRRRLVPSFLMLIALIAPLAVASLYTVYTSGFAGIRLDLSTGVAINTISNGWLIEAQLMLVPLSVLIAWMFRFRWWSLLPLLMFATFRAGTGGRGPFIVACAAAGLLWLYDNRRRWPTARMFALLLPLTAIFYLVGQERTLVRGFLQNGKVVEIQEKSGFMESMDWANLEFFEYLVETVPRKTGTYGYFVDSLQIFTEPVPRKLWKNKPVGAPIKMFNLFDYGNPIGMTYSLPGYGWMQLGYAGVVLWCGLWGACIGAVYSRFVRGRQGNFQVAFYFAFLPIFIIGFRDGNIVTVARTGVFYLTPILGWMWMTRAMGIPDPAEHLRPAARRNPPGSQAEGSTPVRSRRLQPEIVPRAWRDRGGAQRSE